VTILYQTEWCPSSHRVRQRLTELGVDYVVRQVPVAKGDRHALVAVAGTDTIPVLVGDRGEVIPGADAILTWLDAHGTDSRDAAAHRARAEHHQRQACAELHAIHHEVGVEHGGEP
jgi:glutathione S-transferase